MTVFEIRDTLTKKDEFCHIPYPFELDADYKRLTLTYSYSPKRYEDEKKALNLVKECYRGYGINISGEEARAELPLNNLITISLDSPSGIVGCAHRHAEYAVYTVTETEASYGFFPTVIEKGEWRAVLSTHGILSDKVDIYIKIEAN